MIFVSAFTFCLCHGKTFYDTFRSILFAVVSFENVQKIYIRIDFRSFHLSESNGHQSTFYIRKVCQNYSIIMLIQVNMYVLACAYSPQA